MTEVIATTPAWVALAYLVAGVLFILALRGLSSPETSQQGNRFGMIGMLIAVVTTLIVHEVGLPLIVGAVAIGGGIGFVIARRIAMTAMPQLVAGFHSLVGLAAVLVAIAAYLNPAAFGILNADGSEIADVEQDRDGPRRRDRRDHLFGIDHRLPQAQRQYERLADPVAGAAHHQHRAARGDPDPRRGVQPPQPRDVRRDRRDEPRDRLPADHPDRRGRHAGRRVDAQQLFGLGGGGDGLHAAEHRDDRHRRARRVVGRDPQLHHVHRDEPQLHQRHRRRLRRRCGRRGRGEAARRSRSSAAAPRTRRS